MEQIDDLDILIKKQFDKLYSELDKEKQSFINPKSIENIIFHLIDNPKLNPRENKKLQELGEIRMKKKLLEYFNAVRNTDLNKESAIDLYQSNFMKICEFMSQYYGFSSNGGKSYITSIFLILTLSIPIDTILISINWISYPLFTFMFLSLFFVRKTVKSKEKKQYGMLY